jgi:hypothetical protein
MRWMSTSPKRERLGAGSRLLESFNNRPIDRSARRKRAAQTVLCDQPAESTTEERRALVGCEVQY